MTDQQSAGPLDAAANRPPRAAYSTLRAYAKEHELQQWRLAELCAVTRHEPDDEIAIDAVSSAVAFLDSMTLGG